MGYINPDWITGDKHAKNLYDAGVYTDIEVNVDAKLYRDCADRGIDIPVDGSGFVDSVYLQSIASLLALWYLFEKGAKGIRDSDTDIYEIKAMGNQQQYRDAITSLMYSKV